MIFPSRKVISDGWFLLVGCLCITVATPAAPIRFEGPEIFPIDPRIEQLTVADVNGDGLRDLVIINPRKSRLQILVNQTGAAESVDQSLPDRELNSLPLDARFRLESISAEEQISSVVVSDFSGDGKPDIVYCGNRDEVILLENRGKHGWVESERWQIPDVISGSNALQLGDFDGDSEIEVVVLTETFLYFINRPDRGKNSRLRKLFHSGDLESVVVADINADGADDLVGRSSGDPKNCFIRLGGPQGITTSEFLSEMGLLRFLGVVDASRAQLALVSQRSGRAKLGRLILETVDDEQQAGVGGQLTRFAVPKQSRFGRETAWVDLNGDQRTDVVVANGESGKLQILLQQKDGGFGAPEEFGSYGGIGQVAAADWNSDGETELFLLSHTENQVGVTRWSATGGVLFPNSINIKGVPLGISANVLLENQPPVLALIERVLGESLYLILMGPEGLVYRQALDFKTETSRVEIVSHDVDQDGLKDLVLVAPYEPLRVLRQSGKKLGFESMTIASGINERELTWFGSLDVDGDGKAELVVPQKNAVRALVVDVDDEEGDRVVNPRIKVQLNGESDQSVIGGVVSVPLGSDQGACAWLLDTGLNQLSLQRRGSDGQWRPERTLPLPRGDYLSLHHSVLAMGDGELGVGILSPNAGFIKSLSGSRWFFDVEGTYETGLKGGFLNRCFGADFDGDNSSELIFLETGKHNVELVSTGEASGIELLYRWPVFEARSFRNRRGDVSEPREGKVADFTGDGRLDLMLIVHDRVLLYPQL